MVLKIVDKKRSYFSFHFYLGLPIKYDINVKYLKYNARKEVNIASFSCRTDAFDSTETPTFLAFTRLFLDLDVRLLPHHYKNNIRAKPPALRLNYCNAYM